MRKKFHYAWVICIACTIGAIFSMGVGTTAFSVYMSYIMEVYNFTKSQTSFMPTFQNIICAVFVLIGLWLYKKIGMRWGVVSGLLSFVAGQIVFALSGPWLPGYYIAAACTGVPIAITGVLPISIIISTWFKKKKGIALAISMAGSGFGSLVAPKLIVASVDSNGLTATFFYEAIIVFIAAVLVFVLLRATPEEMGLKPYGWSEEEEAEEAAAKAAADIEAEKAASVPAKKKYIFDSFFAKAAFMFALFMYGWSCVASTSHISVHYTALDFSTQTASTMVSLFGFTIIFGKILFGSLVDKLGAFGALLISGTGFLICFACFSLADVALPFAYAAPVMLGIGHPTGSMGPSFWIAELFPKEQYSFIMGLGVFICYVGGSIANACTGLMADVTGNYIFAYLVMLFAIAIGTAVVVAFFLIQKARTRKAEQL